jgi:mycothiol S-conjugate amidase
MAAAQRPPTTRVEVGPYLERRQAAIAAYRSQISPGSELVALSPVDLRRIHPTEDFALVSARVEVRLPEDDLFAGIASRAEALPGDGSGSAGAAA